MVLTSRRHTCHEARRVCVWRRQYLLEGEPEAALLRLRVRGVHVGFSEEKIGSLGLFRRRNASDPPLGGWSAMVWRLITQCN